MSDGEGGNRSEDGSSSGSSSSWGLGADWRIQSFRRSVTQHAKGTSPKMAAAAMRTGQAMQVDQVRVWLRRKGV